MSSFGIVLSLFLLLINILRNQKEYIQRAINEAPQPSRLELNHIQLLNLQVFVQWFEIQTDLHLLLQKNKLFWIKIGEIPAQQNKYRNRSPQIPDIVDI